MNSILKLEDRIYEAAFLPDLWPDVLHDVAGLIGAEGALIANTSDPKLSWVASDGVRDLFDAFFEEGWAYDNPKSQALIGIQHEGFLSDALVLGEEWMAEQAVYKDFFFARGFGYAAGTVIRVPSGDVIGISVERRRERGPVLEAELAALDVIRPSIARAALLASRLEFARIEAALQALQIANLPSALIREDGRVLNANGLFEGFSAQILIAANDRLRFRNAQADRFFEQCLEMRKANPSGVPDDGHSFPIRGADDRPPAVIHLIPINGAARDIFTRTAFFLIVTPLDRGRVASVQTIQGLFDLTPSEARVGRRLAEGNTIQTIAGDFGLAVETVRSHVKAILAKSGMDRQTDFVAAVSAARPIQP